MQIEETALPGVMVLTPQRHGDGRGFFNESWDRQPLLSEKDRLAPAFVQWESPFTYEGTA